MLRRETQIVKDCGYGNRRLVPFGIAATLRDQVPRVVIHSIHMPPVPHVVLAQLLPIPIEHIFDEWRVIHELSLVEDNRLRGPNPYVYKE